MMVRFSSVTKQIVAAAVSNGFTTKRLAMTREYTMVFLNEPDTGVRFGAIWVDRRTGVASRMVIRESDYTLVADVAGVWAIRRAVRDIDSRRPGDTKGAK